MCVYIYEVAVAFRGLIAGQQGQPLRLSVSCLKEIYPSYNRTSVSLCRQIGLTEVAVAFGGLVAGKQW